MCRKLICLVSSILVLVTGATLQADVFSDDFETPHDYIADGVAGPGWDGFLGLNPGETVDALNASIDHAGQLYIESTGAFYHAPWDPLGPFLYKIVKGDFIASVKVSDYAGTEDAPVYHNNCGLMARANPGDAGPGEDWVAIDYFPIWSCGNFVRTADDNSRTENGHNGRQFDLDPYLQIERKGNVFHFRTSTDGSTWVEMGVSPITRDDLAGVPLQVGLYQATYSDVAGYVAFDNFSVEMIILLTAHDSNPADGATDVTIPLLQWEAGEGAIWHDVYFGTAPDALEFRARYARLQTQYYHVPGITPGTTYYWRIDEVEADGITIHTGDVWSFTATPITAWNPSPSPDTEYVLTDEDLSWSPGAAATWHDVYFGTDETAVTNATEESPEYKGRQFDVTYEPGDLTKDTNYYWRIDEVEADSTTKHKGEVWRFKTIADIPIRDPDLIGWWKLDEGQGTTAVDWSGHGNNGRLMGDPQWVPGYDGYALELDGDDDIVDIPYSPDMTPSEGATMSAWVFPMDTNRGTIVGQFGAYGIALDNGLQLKSVIWGDDWVLSDVTIDTGQWSHIAMTWDVTNTNRMIFLNGELVGQQGGATPIPEVTNDLGIGLFVGWPSNWPPDWFTGIIDDVRLYKKVLTAAEIPQTMRGDPLLAWNPSPPRWSTTDIEHATPLRWSPGDKASQHDVYFGTDERAVSDADAADTTGVYRGRQSATSYTPPEGVEWGGGPYYWRIDEYNTDATISKGNIWSFAVADYFLVDDFEAYNDLNPDVPGSNRIFLTWIDGYDIPTNGSIVGYADPPFCEQTIVHGGRQSMPLFYDNAGPAYYSEATLTLSYPRDWTKQGVKVLTLWLYGDPANAPEQIYLAVSNATGPTAVVYNDNPDAATIDTWTEWNINLEDFSNAGVVLTNVDRLAIGFGNRNNPQVGGSGMVFIDDIRLYRPATDTEAE